MRSARATLFLLTSIAACSSRNDSTPRGTQQAPAPPTTQATGADLRLLPGSLHPLARPEHDVGRMDPETRIEGMALLLASPASNDERRAVLAELQNPASPEYHRWYTPEQYAARFGAQPADVARAEAWLKDQGFDVVGPSRTATRLVFSGTAAQVERAFHTEMHRYEYHVAGEGPRDDNGTAGEGPRDDNGTAGEGPRDDDGTAGDTHFAMSRAPSVPAELGDLVVGLAGTHSFRPPPPRHAVTPAYKAGSGYALSPADFAAIYDVAPLYAAGVDGTGMKVAIAGQTTLRASDITNFRKWLGLDATNLPDQVLVPSSGAPYLSPNDLVEAELDCEWSGGVAKNAKVEYVYTGNDPNYGVFDSIVYAVEQTIAPVVSVSYGGCEYGGTKDEAVFYGTLGDAASMFGMTLLASSGDQGAAACDYGAGSATQGLWVDFPADIPSVVAVGGTALMAGSGNFDSSGYATGYITEDAWNDSPASVAQGGGIAASGGGASIIFTKPAWQTGVTPNDGARDVPDVSLAASPYHMPYLEVYSGQLIQIGGTSASSPSFAGILTLVNQAIGAPPGLGNANPVLYALAQSAPGAFHDITVGSNIVPCTPGTPDCPSAAPYQYGYSCGPGYDEVTGNGSIDAAKLVAAYKSLLPTATQLTAQAMGTTEGSPLQLVANVTSNGTSTAMGGSVTFYYETLNSNGVIDVSAPLGTVSVTPSSGSPESATATLATHAPPGLLGQANVVAFYGGDAHYLASWSAVSQVKATSTLAITPTDVTVNPPVTWNVQFNASGGQAPLLWGFETDNSNATIDPKTGLYTAGDAGAFDDTVLAIDQYGAEAVAVVHVVPVDAGAPDADAGTPPQDSGAPPQPDAEPGVDAAMDTGAPDTGSASSSGGGADAAMDAGPAEGDGGGKGGTTKAAGCGCRVAGAQGEGAGGGGAAGFVGMLAGVAGVGVRRRRRYGWSTRAAAP